MPSNAHAIVENVSDDTLEAVASTAGTIGAAAFSAAVAMTWAATTVNGGAVCAPGTVQCDGLAQVQSTTWMLAYVSILAFCLAFGAAYFLDSD